LTDIENIHSKEIAYALLKAPNEDEPGKSHKCLLLIHHHKIALYNSPLSSIASPACILLQLVVSNDQDAEAN
jgi:hypothetical protein